MATDTCVICKAPLARGFMDKLVGTVIKVKKKDGSLSLVEVCSSCQKEKGAELKTAVLAT